ncbi:MAG: hypothetical protein AMXMBFR82_19760 [Candidatus Hydrogenedentota bacterium]
MEHEERLVVVFAGPITQADFARSVLEGHGIEAYLADEAVGTWLPWYASAGGASAVKVAVPESQADEARMVLANPENQGELESDECR